ncbi:MFS transporter [Streptomyces diastatochromogenes]|uniref:MFS transporter n=1 Tax=Streptomyces diastatochromogenes TaxID=42236 RepID=UPI003699A44B
MTDALPAPTRTPADPRTALAALSLGLFMIVVDVSIVAVAVRGLDAGLTSVVWVTSAYLLAYAVPMLFTSRLGDRHGPRRVFLAGLVVFTGASLCSAPAGDVGTLIAARAVQGFGAALLTPQTLTLITHLYPGGERGRAMGVLGGVSGLASSGTPPRQLLPGLLLTGLGMGLVLVPVNNVAMRTVRAELRGVASGVFFTGRQLGSVLGSAAVGVLLQARIAARVADAANTEAQRLPARYRADFAASLRGTAETSQAGGARIRLPDSLPAHLLPQAQDLAAQAAQAVQAGLACAAADTLVLVVAVLVLGVPAAAAVPGNGPVPVDPDTV